VDAQFVRVLVETGLAGLAAFLWLMWRLLHVAWTTYQRFRGTRFESLALGYLAGLVGLFVHAFGANTFIIVRIMEPFWFFTGVVTMLPLLQPENGPGTAPSQA
jgi:hypothetical protein